MLQVSVETKDQTSYMYLSGPMDDQAAKVLSEALPKLTKQVVVNFKAVEYFNSLGIRTWVNFLRSLLDGRKVSYEDCTMDFIQQINMIPALSKGVEILSFGADFCCRSCGFEQSMSFRCDVGRKALLDLVEHQTCRQCKGSTYLEEEPETFLFFMKN